MNSRYVWLVWSSAFVAPSMLLWWWARDYRFTTWRASLATASFGLTEPLFVPAYWNPPSLFNLARKTGLDLESLIFSFSIGGVGAVLYKALSRRYLTQLPADARGHARHLASGSGAH